MSDPLLIAIGAVIGTVVNALTGFHRSRKEFAGSADKAHSEALAALDPMIGHWITRTDSRLADQELAITEQGVSLAAQSVELSELRLEVIRLRKENEELRAELEVLRARVRAESRLRRQYQALLIEHGLIEAGEVETPPEAV